MYGVPLGGISDFDGAVTHATPLRITKVVPEREGCGGVEEIELLGHVAVRDAKDGPHVHDAGGHAEEDAWRRDVCDGCEPVVHFGLEEGKKRTIRESSVPHNLAILVDAGSVLTLSKQSTACLLCQCHVRLLPISLGRQSISRNRKSSPLSVNRACYLLPTLIPELRMHRTVGNGVDLALVALVSMHNGL